MKKTYLIGIIFSLFILPLCANAQNESAVEEAVSEVEAATAEQTQFGSPISDTEITPLLKVSQIMEQKDSADFKTKAVVLESCQRKGCWMTINTSDGELAEPIMVRFRDYGFFVPKDISGSTVLIEGTAYRQVTSVADLRHYASDAGKSKEEIEAITEPKEELVFIADGVKIIGG